MNRDHSVRRIQLPSGKSIEVVRFGGGHGAAAQDAPAHEPLHVCQECSSELVQPSEWHQSSDDLWELTLYCPNCDWACHGSYGHQQLEQLEEQLDLGVEAIVRDLKRLTSANMADEIERFAAALETDLILPEDF
jgi:thiol-disulfide isomerase/thioredoxin